jgi:autotransporter-associated beta strand protein
MSTHGSTRLAIAAAMVALFPMFVHGAILSAKRGFADTGANYNNLQATGAGWYYTWGTGDGSPGTFDAENYPMFWGWAGQSTIDSTLAVRPDYILGYNEPERPDQANMTVATAISNWTSISNSTVAYNNANGTNIKLVSPAVADTGGSSGGQAWLANFMSQANTNGLKVDAVAFHWYGVSTPDNPSGAASSFLSRVASYYNSYHLPVFITEFAIHDWGGSYTDAQIIEANRQFLNIIIPELESRSYVAGYAWYHWFSDAHLYDSATNEPTVMAYDYIGAVQSGSTSEIGGTNLGEHIAYLNGGQLTMNGTAGTVKYLEALYDPNVSTNTSVISGSINWGPTNWTKIQAGATLRKSGANTISLTTGTVTNNGTLDVAQGVLRLGVGMSGSGSVNIYSDGGATGSTARLELTGNIYLPQPITFAQRNDPGGSDGIRNLSGNNTLAGPMTIVVGGNQARVQSDAGQLTMSGPITTNATSARNLYLQGAGNGVVSGVISDNVSNPNGKVNLWKEGAGTWTLKAPNTYTGQTTIAQGTLKLDTIQPSNVSHRWSFNGNMFDSVGGSTATIVNVGANDATLSSTQATLTGGTRSSSDYIRLGLNLLPNTNTPVTIELWATPLSIQSWSRIFDFGYSDNENLYMAWTKGSDINSDKVGWKDGTTYSFVENSNQPYNLNTEYHIVLELNPVGTGSTQVMWYSAPSGNAGLGSAKGSFTTTNSLASFLDNEDNLGRSFYSSDYTANASYNEVRFWNGSLSSTDLETLHDAGPNANISLLSLGSSGLLPSTTAVNMSGSGATLDLNGINQTVGSLTGVTGSSLLLGSGTLTVGGNGTSTTYSGDISGTGGVIKIGGGTLTLGGDIAIGSMQIDGGVMEINSLSASTSDITGDSSLFVGNGSSAANLTADSIAVGTLRIAAGAKVTIRPLPGGPLSGDVQPVPEPASIVLLIIAAAIYSMYAGNRLRFP